MFNIKKRVAAKPAPVAHGTSATGASSGVGGSISYGRPSLHRIEKWLYDHPYFDDATKRLWSENNAGLMWANAVGAQCNWDDLFDYYERSHIVSTDPSLAGEGAFHWWSGVTGRDDGVVALQITDSPESLLVVLDHLDGSVTPGLYNTGFNNVAGAADGQYFGWSYDYAGIEVVGVNLDEEEGTLLPANSADWMVP